jgi:hypothetical protein
MVTTPSEDDPFTVGRELQGSNFLTVVLGEGGYFTDSKIRCGASVYISNSFFIHGPGDSIATTCFQFGWEGVVFKVMHRQLRAELQGKEEEEDNFFHLFRYWQMSKQVTKKMTAGGKGKNDSEFYSF